LKISPDCSGYGIFEAVNLSRLQMPFERKAGSPFLNYHYRFASKKIFITVHKSQSLLIACKSIVCISIGFAAVQNTIQLHKIA